jgi:hypothetical protein
MISAVLLKGSDEVSPSKICEMMQPLDGASLPLISVKNFKSEEEEEVTADEETGCDLVVNVEYKTEQNVHSSYKFFKCSDCDHIFPSHKKLLEHVQGNTSDPSLKVLYRHKCGFFCEICKTRLLNNKSLLLHKVSL